MTSQNNTSQHENSDTTSGANKSSVVRWIIGVVFAIFTIVNGFHFSSIFLLCSAFLMLPLPFVEEFFQKKNIKTIVAIILSVVLFSVGALTSPPAETDDSSDDTMQITQNDNDNKNALTKPNSTTAKKDNTTTEASASTTKSNNSNTDIEETSKAAAATTDEEKVQMVWVASTGKKYHSHSGCSNMDSPRQITLEEAEKQGYTACKKCH